MDHKNLQEKARHKTAPCNRSPQIDSHVCGRGHMATETASHILCGCVALAELGLRCLGKHFY
jgi:hypothetical protein